MDVSLHEEGVSTYVDYSEPAVEAEQPVETEQPAVEEPIPEETAAEPAVEEKRTFTEEELLEAMEYVQRRMQQEQVKPAPVVEPAKEEVRQPSSDPVLDAIQKAFDGIDDDQVATGKDLKATLIKAFSNLSNQNRQHFEETEKNLYQQGAEIYIKNYIPKLMQSFGAEPGSIEANYLGSSFIEFLAAAQQEAGATGKAVELAAAAHVKKMSELFSKRTKPATTQIPEMPKDKLPLDKKLASGNTSATPQRPVDKDIQDTLERIKTGKASTAELLRTLNLKK